MGRMQGGTETQMEKTFVNSVWRQQQSLESGSQAKELQMPPEAGERQKKEKSLRLQVKSEHGPAWRRPVLELQPLQL